MTEQFLKVGIVGLQPGRSWAAKALVPALCVLPENFEIVGVANTNLESGEKAAIEMGLPKAFANVAELFAANEVDVVTITVKVSHHLELVKAALEAGKQVCCEWPLVNTPDEADELAARAKPRGVLGVIGNRAGVAPEIQYLKQLVADGFIGEVLSTTFVARGGQWAQRGRRGTRTRPSLPHRCRRTDGHVIGRGRPRSLVVSERSHRSPLPIANHSSPDGHEVKRMKPPCVFS